MASGPEHYAEAERLLAASGAVGGDPLPPGMSAKDEQRIAAAQVHATLAQTAALAEAFDLARSFYGANMTPGCTDWQTAIHGGPDL